MPAEVSCINGLSIGFASMAPKNLMPTMVVAQSARFRKNASQTSLRTFVILYFCGVVTTMIHAPPILIKRNSANGNNVRSRSVTVRVLCLGFRADQMLAQAYHKIVNM